MKTNMDKLKGKITERGITKGELATKIGMDESTFYRKMKADGLAFTVGQMHKMVDVLGITADEAKTFFALKLA